MHAAGDSRKAVISDPPARDSTTGRNNAGSSSSKAQPQPNQNGTTALPPTLQNTDGINQSLQLPFGQVGHTDTAVQGTNGHQQQQESYVPSFKLAAGQQAGMGGGVMALPLQPVTLAFKNVCYFVEAPAGASQLAKVSCCSAVEPPVLRCGSEEQPVSSSVLPLMDKATFLSSRGAGLQLLQMAVLPG